MASTTTSTLDDLFVNIVREAIFTAQESSLVRNLVTTYDISGDDGKAIQVPIYPEVSAAALTEGSDMSSTAVSTTSATITAPGVGVHAVLTDLAARSSSRGIAADLGKVLGEAVAKKMDEDLIALFDGSPTRTVVTCRTKPCVTAMSARLPVWISLNLPTFLLTVRMIPKARYSYLRLSALPSSGMSTSSHSETLPSVDGNSMRLLATVLGN